jgi:hypothetical protein
MRYVTLSILSALLLTTSLPAMAVGGMNKHDTSIATYNYDLPIVVNTSTLSTGSLRDEIDNGTRLAPEKPMAQPTPMPAPTAPAVIKATPTVTTSKATPSTTVTTVTTVTTPAVPVAPIVTPKATDVLPDTLPKATVTTVPAVPMPAPPIPEAVKPAVEGMMGGQAVPPSMPATPAAPASDRVPLATTKGM